MASADPDMENDFELGADAASVTLTEYRHSVQKYPSNNIALDKEFRVAYPSTSLHDFDSLTREDKIKAVAQARMLLRLGNQPVIMSVENLLEGKTQREVWEFGSPRSHASHVRAASHHSDSRGPSPLHNPVAPPALLATDASIAQVLCFMQQQQHYQQQQQQFQHQQLQMQFQQQIQADRENARRQLDFQERQM